MLLSISSPCLEARKAKPKAGRSGMKTSRNFRKVNNKMIMVPIVPYNWAFERRKSQTRHSQESAVSEWRDDFEMREQHDWHTLAGQWVG